MKAKAENSQVNKFLSDNGIWVVLVVLIFAITLVNRNFFTPQNAVALLTGESIKGVLTFGVMMAILAKGIDLSTGSVAALSAIVSAALCQQMTATKLWAELNTMPAIVGILAGILIMGVINNGMVMMGVNDQMTFIVKGLIIIGAVAFDMRKNRVKA